MSDEKFTSRTTGDFCFRVWDGESMADWLCLRQTAFNVNLKRGESPLMYRAWTHPDWVVMQSTGLVDENRKQVFEGDVLEFNEAEWGGRCLFVMEWDAHNCTWSHPGCHSDISSWCAIVGNVYENPELIPKLTT